MKSLVMRLPAITTEMDTGRLLKWMVAIGDSVKAGDPICEFTTDKVDTELESPYTGTVKRLLVPEGGRCAVGEGICVIEGEAADLLGDLPGHEHEDAVQEESGAVTLVNDPCLGQFRLEEGKVLAPRAIRLQAKSWDIDLKDVPATGSRGQVTMADLKTFAQVHGYPKDPEPDPPAPLIGLEPEPRSRMEYDLSGGERRLRPRSERSERRGSTRRHRRGAAREDVHQSEPTTTPEVAAPVASTPVAPLFQPGVTAMTTQPVITSVVTPHVVVQTQAETTQGTLFAQVDITDVMDVQAANSNFTLLARLVWAYGQALWQHRELNGYWDQAQQVRVAFDHVCIHVGMESPASTMVDVPICIAEGCQPEDLLTPLTQGYETVRGGGLPIPSTSPRSGSLLDLGPWQVERVTPHLSPAQLTAISLGCIQTLPSLIGRTITVRQLVTIGLGVDYRVVDPVQAGAFLSTLVSHLTMVDGVAAQG